MSMPPKETNAPCVVVVEKSPFTRMSFIGVATRFPGELFLHENLPRAIPSLRSGRPATLFINRAAILEAAPDALSDLVAAMTTGRIRVVVLVARNDPRDVGGRMSLPVEWFATTPCPPPVLVQLAHGEAPQDDGVNRGGAPWSVASGQGAGTPQPFPAATSAVRPAAPTATPPPFAAVPAGMGRSMTTFMDEVRRDRLMCSNIEKMDHYEVLGMPVTASRRDLLSAYLALVRRFHPDLSAAVPDSRMATEMRHVYRRITDAWAVLNDDARRQAYIQVLVRGARSPGPGARAMAG